MPVSHATGGRTARLGALDALRFIAALSVVAFHYTGITPGWGGRAPAELDRVARWASYGTMGVPLFFVISGFVILLTAWERDVPQFLASRVGRLFPAYWTAVAIAAVIAFVVWPEGSVVDGRPPTEAEAALNLTMVQGAFGAHNLDGPYWTLWAEARFYLLVALFMLVGITRQRVLAFATLWPVLAVIAQQAGQAMLSTLLIADYAPFFAGGMLLYVIYRDGHDLGTWLLVGLQSIFALYFALGHYPDSIMVATGWAPSKVLVAGFSLACFGLVALVVLTPLSRCTAGWMSVLGALTYPLYLVHERLGLFIVNSLRETLNPWLVLAIAGLSALVLAAGIHYAVERPLGGRLRHAMLASLQRTSDADGSPRTGAHRALPGMSDGPATHIAARQETPRPRMTDTRTSVRLPAPMAVHD